MSGIDAIFDQVPVDESSNTGESAEQEPITRRAPTRETVSAPSDRVRKGDTNSRIASFGELVEEDDYGQDDKGQPVEVKVEKDKTPISKAEAPSKKKEPRADDKKEDVEDEGVEEEVAVEEKLAPEPDLKTKLKVKVDGLEQEVTLEDLKASYSGKQAISKRFTELDKEKKAFQKREEMIMRDIENVQNEVKDLKGNFEGVISEYQKKGFLSSNPMTVVHSLLDKLGLDSHTFDRALFEHNLPEYARFFEMDEYQQDAYFTKKENEFLRKKDQTLAERTQRAQSETERQKNEYNLIKKAGLTVDAYNELFGVLEELGDNEITAEKVVEFAKVKPILDKSGEIVSKTSKKGDVDLIQKVASILIQFPSTTEEEIIAEIDGTAEAERVVKTLSKKENFGVKVKPKKATDDEEIDMELFKSMRR